MLYEYDLIVPANTAEAEAVEQRMKLTAGVIHRVEVQFPIGTRALIHVQIFRGGHQVWPTNLDGNIKADGYVVAWDENYELSAGDNELVAKGWSTADTYSYTVSVRVGILAKEAVNPWAHLAGALSKVLKFFGAGG